VITIDGEKEFLKQFIAQFQSDSEYSFEEEDNQIMGVDMQFDE
jgi:hypothetical protein